MNRSKSENDPISYLYRKFACLEFKERETISSLIKNYYPLNKYEEIYIKDISIPNKNEFISQLKKIFHELTVSMETLEYIFNEYYHFINKNEKENPFSPLQKSEVINKLGISSNMYNKILTLFNNILYYLRDEKEYEKNNKIRIENNDMEVDNDEEMKEENKKMKKINLENKIDNINSLCNEMESLFSTYYKNKKDENTKENKENNQETKKDKNFDFSLTSAEKEELRKRLDNYESELSDLK